MALVRMTLQEAAKVDRIGRTKVHATTEEAIRLHMVEDGEDPDAPLPAGRVVHSAASLRQKLGITQPGMAARLRVPLKTWRNWEQGRVGLDPAVRALLDLVADDPERAFRVVGAAAAGEVERGHPYASEETVRTVAGRRAAPQRSATVPEVEGEEVLPVVASPPPHP